jgi:hypothetical protein
VQIDDAFHGFTLKPQLSIRARNGTPLSAHRLGRLMMRPEFQVQCHSIRPVAPESDLHLFYVGHRDCFGLTVHMNRAMSRV